MLSHISFISRISAADRRLVDLKKKQKATMVSTRLLLFDLFFFSSPFFSLYLSHSLCSIVFTHCTRKRKKRKRKKKRFTCLSLSVWEKWSLREVDVWSSLFARWLASFARVFVNLKPYIRSFSLQSEGKERVFTVSFTFCLFFFSFSLSIFLSKVILIHLFIYFHFTLKIFETLMWAQFKYPDMFLRQGIDSMNLTSVRDVQMNYRYF